MLAYILRRLLATIPVMGIVAIFVFSLLYIAPGDPAAIIAGDLATAEDIARIHRQLGLDEPFFLRFGHWLWGVLHGDLGISIFTNLPVTELIAQRLEPTLALTLTTLVVTVLFAIPLGVIAAWKVGTWIDRSVMIVAVMASRCLPSCWHISSSSASRSSSISFRCRAMSASARASCPSSSI